MDTDREAVMERFSIAMSGVASELELARDDVLGEVTFADEVRNDIDFWGIDHEKRLAHGWLLFPETDVHFGKEIALTDFGSVLEVGGGGIWVFGRTVADDEESGVWLRSKRHGRKLARDDGNASE